MPKYFILDYLFLLATALLNGLLIKIVFLVFHQNSKLKYFLFAHLFIHQIFHFSPCPPPFFPPFENKTFKNILGAI